MLDRTLVSCLTGEVVMRPEHLRPFCSRQVDTKLTFFDRKSPKATLVNTAFCFNENVVVWAWSLEKMFPDADAMALLIRANCTLP